MITIPAILVPWLVAVVPLAPAVPPSLGEMLAELAAMHPGLEYVISNPTVTPRGDDERAGAVPAGQPLEVLLPRLAQAYGCDIVCLDGIWIMAPSGPAPLMAFHAAADVQTQALIASLLGGPPSDPPLDDALLNLQTAVFNRRERALSVLHERWNRLREEQGDDWPRAGAAAVVVGDEEAEALRQWGLGEAYDSIIATLLDRPTVDTTALRFVVHGDDEVNLEVGVRIEDHDAWRPLGPVDLDVHEPAGMLLPWSWQAADQRSVLRRPISLASPDATFVALAAELADQSGCAIDAGAIARAPIGIRLHDRSLGMGLYSLSVATGSLWGPPRDSYKYVFLPDEGQLRAALFTALPLIARLTALPALQLRSSAFTQWQWPDYIAASLTEAQMAHLLSGVELGTDTLNPFAQTAIGACLLEPVVRSYCDGISAIEYLQSNAQGILKYQYVDRWATTAMDIDTNRSIRLYLTHEPGAYIETLLRSIAPGLNAAWIQSTSSATYGSRNEVLPGDERFRLLAGPIE